ncbi:AAA domain-containing protein [Mesoflavibacter zeaxanthinifaciens]|uniref:AAA domain-containing protein n=1 Tax=Mesoflavibacter zeaxanthinifaciens TaxID=393060 RepID=UPI003A9259EB
MAYSSYLLDKFEYTHENRFFRLLDEKLMNCFEEKEGDHVLIGNLNVGGHSLDALFIKRGAMIVIDFKDYTGELSFSENGPWRIKTNTGKTIFVSGGAHSRNPYQQVNAYRFALFQYLDEKQTEILDANHNNINWAHTSCLVLFQREASFDIKTIPTKIQRYFNITHFDIVLDDLQDYYSDKLNFSKSEIQKILKVLNIGQDSLYLRNNISDEVPAIAPIDPARMDRIIQLIPDVTDENEIIRSLAFYNTMLSIERINEASAQDIHHYPIHWGQINTSNHIINIESNTDFLDLWLRNKTQNFPKGLFISVNLLFEDIIVPFFYTIVLHSEIEENNEVTVNFDDFDLYRPVLQELNLTEDIIEELATAVNSKENLKDKINATKEYLDVSLELVDRFSLGLSNESMFTSQVQSELNQWVKKKSSIANNVVFKSFLSHSKINKANENDSENILQITPLNKSQRKGIELSFQQPLTIITGPPGTGKSQVVANILANAVYRNQKVLFSSKNNKAVDNVHQRISTDLNTNYFLRLGTKTHNLELIEKLELTLNEINHGGKYPDKSDKLDKLKNRFNTLMNERNSLISKLASVSSLQKEIPLLRNELNKRREAHQNWLSSLNYIEKDLYIDKSLEYNISISTINEIKRTVTKSRNGWLAKKQFNWFNKATVLKNLNSVSESLPKELREYVDTNAPIVAEKGDLVAGLEKHLNFVIFQKKIQSDLRSEHAQRLDKSGTLENELKQKEEALKSRTSNQDNFKNRIREITDLQPTLGLELLELVINEKLRKANISVIETYKNYIENGMPWRSEELMECSHISDAFLEIFNSVSITSLNIKKAFLQEAEIFDLLVIDEASQCDITSAIPLIYRAKRVVIIGDSLQLPHITSVKLHEQQFVLEKLNLSPSKYNYIQHSLFEKAKSVGNISLLESAFLDQHYRCHPDIIGFSNQYYYLARAGHQLKIKTNPEDFKYGQPGMHWLDVKGTSDDSRNINTEEVQTCVKLAQQLAKQYPNASIGIATPFRHQKEELTKAINDIPERQNMFCDVIHKFQGDEKDIVILSLVVTDNCKATLPSFIDRYSPYLLNVAVTRAQSALYIVGNKHYCSKLRDANKGKTLLAKLASYESQINS